MVHYRIFKGIYQDIQEYTKYTNYNILGYTGRYTGGLLRLYRGILTMDGREEAANEVLVEAPILTHSINLLPLGICHVLLDCPRTHLLPRYVLTTKL